jgi:5-methylcytosine-specific restriction endonuclease McrA
VTVKRRGGRAIHAGNQRILAACPVCHICGQPIDLALKNPHPMAGVIDHVIPLAKGGRDDRNNKKPSHRRCNRMKSDKDFAPIVRRSGSLD